MVFRRLKRFRALPPAEGEILERQGGSLSHADIEPTQRERSGGRRVPVTGVGSVDPEQTSQSPGVSAGETCEDIVHKLSASQGGQQNCRDEVQRRLPMNPGKGTSVQPHTVLGGSRNRTRRTRVPETPRTTALEDVTHRLRSL